MKEIIDKYLKNTCTGEERLLVETFLQSYQKEDEWPANLKEVTKEAIWRKISDKAINPSRRGLLIYLAAASLALFALCATWFVANRNSATVKEAKNGEPILITLPDQSTVLLSRGSLITYPKTFGKIREVQFTGEAFFVIQRDTARPFVVKAEGVTATVLGTSFMVNTFRNNETDVTVVTGKVEVAAKGNERLVLTSGQIAKVDKKSGNMVRQGMKVDVEKQLPNNTLKFDGIPMREAANIIERRYGVEIHFDDKSLERRLIKSDYKNQPLENVIESLSFIQDMKYEKKGNKIFFIKHKKK